MKRIFFKGKDEGVSNLSAFINITIVIALFICLLIFSFNSIGYKLRLYTIYEYRYKFYLGFLMTVVISIFSLILSLIIGTLSALSSHSKFLPVYYTGKVYVEIIRGTPLLVQIMVFYYIIATALRVEDRYVMGILILSLFEGAYISEIIRAGVESIGKTQLETAKSLGFTGFQTLRYVILPQVVKRILPPLTGQFVSLVKDSSLLSIIAVNELTKNVQEVDSINFASLENYILLALLYMLLTIPISALSRKLEGKFHYES